MSKQCSITDHPVSIAMQGLALDEDAVVELELHLKQDPSDCNARLKLIGYYFERSQSSKQIRRKHLQHVILMIKNMPSNEILATPMASIFRDCDPDGYAKCKGQWLVQLAALPDDVNVVQNAAYFLEGDKRLAEKLYLRAVELEPANPDMHRNLAWFLHRKSPRTKPRLGRALYAIQNAIELTEEKRRKSYLYTSLANIAYDAGQWALAASAAQECIESAREFTGDWNEGNAVHDGNCILGRLALRRGHRRKAISYLDEAGKTKGSPQLDSFGPNMRFAQEMLRAGERDAVIRYLENCKQFWDGYADVLSDCIAKIRKGRSPRLPRVI